MDRLQTILLRIVLDRTPNPLSGDPMTAAQKSLLWNMREMEAISFFFYWGGCLGHHLRGAGGWPYTDDVPVVKMNPSGLVVSDVLFIDAKPLKFHIDCVDFLHAYNKVAVRECVGTSGDKLDPRCPGSLNCPPGSGESDGSRRDGNLTLPG